MEVLLILMLVIFVLGVLMLVNGLVSAVKSVLATGHVQDDHDPVFVAVGIGFMWIVLANIPFPLNLFV